MCKPKPGPRCAAHAWTNLVAAQEKLNEYKTQIAGSPKTRDISIVLDSLEVKVNRAQAEFNSTPRGIKLLEERLRKARDNKADYEDARRKLDQARRESAVAQIAGKLSTSPSYMQPTEDPRIRRILRQQDLVSSKIAELVNNGAPAHHIKYAEKIEKDLRMRHQALVDEFLLKRKGILQPQYVSFDHLPENKEVFMKMPKDFFQNRGDSFPEGAYVRVSNPRLDEVGNILCSIEGLYETRVSRNQNFVVNSR